MLGRIWKYASNNALLAGIISGAVVLGLGAWKWPDLGPAFRATWGWLAADAGVSRGKALLILVGYFVASLGMFTWAAGHWLNRVRERAVEDYKRTSTRDTAPTVPKAVTMGPVIPTVNDRLTVVRPQPASPEPVKPPEVATGFTPNERQKAVLQYLLTVWPRAVDVNDAQRVMLGAPSGSLQLTPAHVAEELYGLVNAGVLETSGKGMTLLFRLTDHGRTWAVRFYDDLDKWLLS